MSEFRPQDARIFRPYPDEAPWALLAESGVDEAALAAGLSLDQVRIAKHDGRVVGAYALRQAEDLTYELVALAVVDDLRRRGLGRWLLGHALGLAESRGGRSVRVAAPAGGLSAAARRLLTGIGFEADGAGLRIELIPE